MAESELIEKASQFDDTPEGWARRWSVEMEAADKELSKWWERGDKVVRRYTDDRRGDLPQTDVRVNLFTANVQTQRAMLYGQVPRVEVKRRFADPGDDPARLAGEILQRLLNTDIERDSDTYAQALFAALDDWLLPGLGNARVRYEVEHDEPQEVPAVLDPETGEELAPAYTPEPQKIREEVAVDYLHWRDQKWSPCRTGNEIRWWAYKADMTRDAMHSRFDGVLGAEKVDLIPLDSKDKWGENNFAGQDNNPWSRAEVWEIWNKDDRKVYFWVKGAPWILDIVDDPLGLDGFFPHPPPLIANVTSSKYLPVPDFTLAQDQYDEIDEVSTRITLLEKAVAARGLYDKTSEEAKRLLSEAKTNDMIPVDNWAMFAEKGGIKGVVDWLPIDMVVAAMDKLREYRGELIGLLYQVTGMSDIMRGQSSGGQATATEQAIKAKFAGVRMQFRQGEFARFASDLQKLKAEIIAKHFSPETIAKGSNVQFMVGADQGGIQAAIQLIKEDVYQYRVEVKPEAISMADYAAVKAERSEMLTAVATFLQSSLPVMQGAPIMAPMLLQMLQWALAGFRGGSTIEGVIDQTIARVQQEMSQPKPPQQDPAVQTAQIKAQADQFKAKADMTKTQMDVAAYQQKARVDAFQAAQDAQLKQQEHELSMKKMQAQLQNDAIRAAMPGGGSKEGV